MNEDDSEQVASLLMQMGYAPASQPEEADIVMLVTCSVREKPEQKAKSKLGELRLMKLQKPEMIIGVCGCMAQRVGESIKKSRPYIDMVVGTGQIARIPGLIRQVVQERRFTSALDLDGATPERAPRKGDALKSFVPVMYGCDNYCSYCVVPYVRGRERSRPVDEIVSEIVDLAHRGRKEVILLGQNVNSYGATLGDSVDFADLLCGVNDVDGIERIRFTTSHPKDLSGKLIKAMRDLSHVCEHIHLPVQSGDDEVLRRMNRKYTSAHFRERVASLRQAIPDIAITTDLLVGFPGETDEQFENTMRLAEELRFDAAFMFAFNAIPGTAAEKLPDQLPHKVKNTRLRRLIALQNEITCDINNSQIGCTYEVLVEGPSPRDSHRLTGLTRQNKTVNFRSDTHMAGDLVQVRVAEGHPYGFVGDAL